MCGKMRICLVFAAFVLVQVRAEEFLTQDYSTANINDVDSVFGSERSCDDGIPGPVQNLSNSVDGQTVTITWAAPEDASCVNEYAVFYEDSTMHWTPNTTYTLQNVPYCTIYQIEVAAFSGDNAGENSSTTAETYAPFPFGAVQNLALTLSDRILNATWSPPLNAAACVGKYMIQIWDQNNNAKDYETTQTFYEFTPVVGCMVYNVQVKPWVNQSMEGLTSLKSHTVGDLPTNPPTNASGSRVDKTWANLMWATDRYTVNMCNIDKISVTCTSSDTEKWVVAHQEVAVNVGDSNSRPNVATNVTDLSEFTNYSCVAVVTNSGGDSEESEPYLFQTLEEVPSEPLSLEVGAKTAEGFHFSWAKPYKIPGILQQYGIIIERGKVQHFIPEDCSIGGETEFATTVEIDVNEYEFADALPNFLYTVYVNASTRVGDGPSASTNVITLYDVPEKPRNVTHSLTITESTEYLVNASISWLLPCNTNGELKHFEVMVIGTPTFEEAENVTNIKAEVATNTNIENVSYEYVIENINASYSYSITVNAVLTDDTKGEEQEISFVSPDGYPGEPTLIQIETSGSDYFFVTWSEPEIKNGELINYTIEIQSHGPLYPVDADCRIDTQIYTDSQSAEELSYNFTRAKPYYNYSVMIAAATSAGYGSYSNQEFVHTEAAQPGPPMSLDYSLEEHDLTDYNVDGIITWSAPCEVNGVLDYFRVIVDSSSTYDDGSENYEDREEANESVFHFSIQRPLKAAYNYSFFVATVLRDSALISDDVETSFVTPDGFPGQPVLDEAQNVGSTYFHVAWTEPSVKNGRLHNYSIVIKSEGPQYPVTEECEMDTSLNTYILPSEDREFNFTEAKPYYKYSVVVSAATSAGYGAQSDAKFVHTEQAEPKSPRDLSASYEEFDLTNYNVTSLISWSLPCEINGILSHFKLVIRGDSTYDEGKEAENEEYIPNDGQFTFATNYALKAAYNYTFSVANVLNNTLESVSSEVILLAPDGYPAAPVLNDPSNNTPNSFDVTWSEPNVTNGRLVFYSLTVTPHGPLYFIPQVCKSETPIQKVYNITAALTSHKFEEASPYHAYSVYIKAATSRGFGAESDAQPVTTQRTASEPVQNLNYTVEYDDDAVEYNPVFTVTFERPCHTYGTFINYSVSLIGQRDGKEPHEITAETENTTYVITSLKPEYSYVLSVRVLTEDDYQSEQVTASFVSNAGVPLGVITEFEPPKVEGAHTAAYTFSDDLFDDSNGEIIYYAIILGMYGSHEESTASTWEGTSDSWPLVGNTGATAETGPYQATPKMWNPFQGSGNSTVTFNIGTGNCTTVYEDCNKVLEPETEYAFKIRGFTSRGYRDSPTVIFVTDKLESARLAMILGIVFGILAALIIAAFMFVLWRRRRQWFERKVSAIETPSAPNSIPVKEFPRYYSNLMLNYNLLKAEYTLLESKTKEITKPITVADLPEHKGKNRYCNIKPFDETRVILRRDANDNCSDYINASYLKGYHGDVEYIATQGPLESTCLDFWRMVLQENVTVIAMVAQCVEQSREKCYQYFPEKHETINVGDDIEVRCTTDLHFGTHIVKNLLVQKDVDKYTVTHLQFVEWPDFGCPSDTSNLLEFCQIMRNCHRREGGKIAVHCSAGVGRSGTLVAIDILLQGIQANRDVDIFGTVLNLREQRPKMVQTEKQYAYIYRCVNDVILNPLKTEEPKGSSEAIYENVEIFKGSISNGSSKERLVKESQL